MERFCSGCGRPLQDGQLFCPACGTQTVRPVKDGDGMALPTMIMVVGVSVFAASLIVGIIGLYIMFGRPPATAAATNAAVPVQSNSAAPALVPSAIPTAPAAPSSTAPSNSAAPPPEATPADDSLPAPDRSTPQPPRRRKVVEASIEFNRVLSLHGMAGAAAYSESCYTALRRRPNWGNLDFCIAFDQIASRRDASAASAMNWSRSEYFDDNIVASRQLTAARRMFNNPSDALSRVAAVRSMADSLL